MRETLGLPAPEENIGAAAHDFGALLLAPRVVLTRAAKVDGAPTVPSRWLLRLRALVDGMGLSLEPEQPWLAWAQQRSAIAKVQPARVPEPRPPVSARPRTLSVTAIEKWIANPYAIFAHSILGLEPLPLLGAPPAPSLRGQIIHEALGRFAQRFPNELPRDVARQLTALAQEVLADYLGNPRIAAFWAPRFGRFAEWFAETEPARRKGLARTAPEVKGKLVLNAPAGPFKLTARADRIDCCPTGLIITDYKNAQGVASMATRAAEGRAPQLPLEAAIAAAGGFDGVPAAAVKYLRYISTSGGEPPGQDIALKVDDVAVLGEEALAGLRRLVSAFDKEATPYRAMRRLKFNYDYDDFAHLARVAEWQAETEEED
jgi:ATP-dependent helicase/nuclease subunit B